MGKKMEYRMETGLYWVAVKELKLNYHNRYI